MHYLVEANDYQHPGAKLVPAEYPMITDNEPVEQLIMITDNQPVEQLKSTCQLHQ